MIINIHGPKDHISQMNPNVVRKKMFERRTKENGNGYENCDRFKFMIIMCTFTFNSSQIISLVLSIVYMVSYSSPVHIYSQKNVYYIDKNNSFR